MTNNRKCCIVVYGCAKNQVDAEEMACRLTEAGYEVTGDSSQADVIIVHTCGFIEDAKRESIEGIFQAVEAANEMNSGHHPAVIVTGCLSQRYPDELFDEIPEVAAIVGTAAPRDIVGIVQEVLNRRVEIGHCARIKRVGRPGRGSPGGANARFDKHVTTAWAYLRISEGCRHHCTYCAIPSIRGELQSRPEDEIVAEARHLVSLGVVEMNLIAQDLSDYGWELEGRRKLAALIRKINDVEGIRWIRLLYVRPDGVDQELADAMALPHVAPYIDLPLEHGSPRILRRMGRPGVDEIRKAVEIMRESVPDLYLRTTIITGFPGETDRDVELTMNLLSEIRAHRVGVFPFSREEGTPAYNLPDIVPADIARERAKAVRLLGLRLASESGATMIGKDVDIVLERPSARPGYWIGRGPHQAPEVDGVTYVKIAPDTIDCSAQAEPARANLAHPNETGPQHRPTSQRFVRARVTQSGILTLFASQTSL